MSFVIAAPDLVAMATEDLAGIGASLTAANAAAAVPTSGLLAAAGDEVSVALFFVWMITVAFLYLVLGGMGVWAKLNSNVGDLLNNASGSSAELVSSGTIFGGAFLIGLVNIVLMTALATIGAFVYNLITDLIGGIEVTLADRD